MADQIAQKETLQDAPATHHPHIPHITHLTRIPPAQKRDDTGHQEDVKYAHLLAKEESDIPPGYFRSVRFLGTMISMSLTVVSSYFGFAVPASVLTYINLDIGPSQNASLFVIVWTMCNAISLLITGRLSDKFGRRYFLLFAGALAVIGGIVACTAKTMNTLIGANVIIGMASGVHSSQSLFTGELIPHRHKFIGIMLILIPMVTSTGLAAYIGRALVETRSWRWIYYIYIMIVGSGWVIQIVMYHPASFVQLHGGYRSKAEEFKRVDHFGLLFLISGLTLFLLGVSWGGNPQPWTSDKILSLIITGGVTLIIFGVYEAYTSSPNPMVDLTLFKDIRGYLCLNIVSMAAGAMYIALSVIWPQQVFLVYSPSTSEWQSQAWMSTTIGWGIWGGIVLLFPLVNIVKHVRRQILGLLILSVIFTAALSQVGPGDKKQANAFSFLTALPIGWLETGTTIIVQLDAADADVGMVYAILSSLRSISGATFTAVFTAILNSKVKSGIASQVPIAAMAAGLPEASLPALFGAIAAQSTAAFAAVPGFTLEVEAAVSSALVEAYSSAFKYVYYTALAIGSVAIIAAAFLKDYDPLMTGHLPKQVYAYVTNKKKPDKMDTTAFEVTQE
ncbi:trichothecene efflux pump [Hyaloscypha bicolor E]|uniref:Trichothecene efflux pump n=1 Tax=Hyaloscypha bicolor E TaxID=1095630 RepID=A0A2J6SGV3_9HELO|nr:trichothecene efflux pump [Hyaloscypha bicolor E]PMD49988.1 trichothecene efflux pump [Hyaloscypha bicolor E]